MAGRSSHLARAGVLAAMLLAWAGAGAQTSPLFDGRTADFWLYDAETGQATGYDKSMWVEDYIAGEYGGIGFDVGDVVLINWLENSSMPMTPGQPAISIAGIGDAALFIGQGGNGGHRDLAIAPTTSGPYAGTLAVNIGVSGTVLAAGGATLAWTVTDVTTASPVVVMDRTVAIPRGAGANGENGYFLQTFYLVRSGDYVVDVSLTGAAANATLSQPYELVIPPEEARRDTDGDGIPDAVEADMGLNPFEDDWTADVDGDGWSEFDEWLRRYCLDPNTRQPIVGDTGCIGPNGVPVDSDDDNWSDFDELLRGTNPFDPEPEIPPQGAAPAGNDAPDVAVLNKGSSLALAPSATDSATFCTDGARFYFDVRFYAEADWTNETSPSDVIFGVGADNFAYQAPVESIRVNFDENGDITRQSPAVSTASASGVDPRDRWLTGPIDDFTIEEGDPFNWHVFGSVAVGTDPLLPGDTVESVAIRSGASGNSYTGGYVVSGDPADCAAGAAEPAYDEYVARQRLRFKDFPAASRLYEVEHTIAPAAGTLLVPPPADLLVEQQSSGGTPVGLAGVVIQSYTPTQDNLAGVDVVLASGTEAVDDVILNVWAGAPRTGELLVTQKLSDVQINGDPDRPLVFRFEPVAVQPGQPVYLEFRKRVAALVATGGDTLAGGGLVEVGGSAGDGVTDLALTVWHDAAFASGIGGTRAGMLWWTVGAADLSGTLAYDASRLLGDTDIVAAGLQPTDVASRRRMPALAAALSANQLPEMRLPAGQTVIVSAVHRFEPAAGDGWRPPSAYSRLYKNWLARVDDVTPTAMLDELGEGSWSTPDEWRNEFIAYIAARLVVPVAPVLGRASTIQVSVLEAALSEEAAFDGSDSLQILGDVFQPGQPVYAWQPGQPVYGNLQTSQSPFVDSWEDKLERLAGGTYNLDGSLAQVGAALAPGQPLEPLGDFLATRFQAGVPGTRSDEYLASQIQRSFDEDCFLRAIAVPDLQADAEGWNVFLDRCPVWFTEAELTQRLAEDRDRGYQVRLNLLPGAAAEIAADATLLDLVFDSDIDGFANATEIEVPIPRLTLPWLFDSDGDLIADPDDICPNDPLNECSNTPVLPTLQIDADFAVFEPATGSDFALVSVQLERLYDVPVTVCFEAISDTLDTATADVDFAAITGCVTIEPGQLSALIAIPVNADGIDEGAESFTVRITSVENATVADDGVVVVTLNDPLPAENTAPVFTSPATILAPEGTTATGYTATAFDAEGDTLVFTASGGVDQGSFVIDSATGELSFAVAPEFANPADANGDNVYEVQLFVDDGNGGTDTLDLAVTVVEVGLYAEVTYPTYNANLGGSASTTIVRGNIVDPLGGPVGAGDVNFVDVNGVSATIDPVNPRRWSVEVPVSAGSNTLTVTLERNDGSTSVISQPLQNVPVRLSLGDVAYDAAGNRLFVLDTFDDVLMSVDVASGERSLVTGPSTGSGPVLIAPIGIDLDLARGRVLLVDPGLDAVVAVDLANGDRSILSNAGLGTGPAFGGPVDLAIDNTGNLAYVADQQLDAVVVVDLATGDRNVISSPTVGTGPVFSNPRDIELDAVNERVLVVDSTLDALLAIDLATGNRTILSDPATGTGRTFIVPNRMALDSANNRVLIADQVYGLIAADLASGDRVVLVDPGVDYGRNGSQPVGVAADPANDRAFISDNRSDSIYDANLSTGAYTVLSDSAAGQGSDPRVLFGPQGMAFDAATGQLLLTDSYIDALVAIDVGTATRSVLSSATRGSGPIFDFPQRITVDPSTNRALFPDDTLDAIFSVDLVSGDRTIISNNSGTGTGPLYGYPSDIAVEADSDRAWVMDVTEGLFQIIPSTGTRAIISSSTVGNGTNFIVPWSMAPDLANNRIYVADQNVPAVIRVDLLTGDRTIVSDNAGAGAGASFSVPFDIELDIASNRAFVADYGLRALVAVNLVSGDRTIVAGDGVGSGPTGPMTTYYVALDVANERAFVYDLFLTGIVIIDLPTGDRAVMAK